MKIKLLSCMFVISLIAATPVEAGTYWYSKSDTTEQTTKTKKPKRMAAKEKKALKEAAERPTLLGSAKESLKNMLAALAVAMRKVSESIEASSRKLVGKDSPEVVQEQD